MILRDKRLPERDAIAFGGAIRAARTGAGMTLADAALTLGISKQTLSDLETARASVGLVTALRVARELGVAIFAVPSTEREPVRRQIIRARRAGSATAAAATAAIRSTRLTARGDER